MSSLCSRCSKACKAPRILKCTELIQKEQNVKEEKVQIEIKNNFISEEIEFWNPIWCLIEPESTEKEKGINWYNGWNGIATKADYELEKGKK